MNPETPLSLEQIQGKRLCLLLRGIAFRSHYRPRGMAPQSVSVDYRRCLQGTRENLIKPLEALGKLEVILASYTSEKDEELLADFAPASHRLFRLLNVSGMRLRALKGLNYLGLSIPGCPILQGELFLEGLRLVAARAHCYDYVIISRFDLEYHLPANLWPASPEKVNLLWKGVEPAWNQSKMVGDCIHILPTRFLEGFMESVRKTRMKGNLHYIYPMLAKSCGEENIHFMYDGYRASNTDTDPNPIYRIVRN